MAVSPPSMVQTADHLNLNIRHRGSTRYLPVLEGLGYRFVTIVRMRG